MRFRSKMLSGSENAPGFRENRLPEATFPPSVMHTALLFCDRHFAGQGKKKGLDSLALSRESHSALQCFHSRHVSPESTEFPSNAHLTLNANFRSRFALSVQWTRIMAARLAENVCLQRWRQRENMRRKYIVRMIRRLLCGITANRRYVVEFTCVLDGSGNIMDGANNRLCGTWEAPLTLGRDTYR